MNLATWVERNGRRLRDEPALAHGERVHATWAGFSARTAAAAAGLRDDLALSPGDRVAIVMRNRPEYLEALFAARHAGLVAVPVNARLHRDEIAYILDDSRAKVVVTDEEHAEDVEPLVDAVEALQAAVLAPEPRWDRLTGAGPTRLVDRAPHDPAWLFYTSGTTGRPKGATLTHGNLLMMSLAYPSSSARWATRSIVLGVAQLPDTGRPNPSSSMSSLTGGILPGPVSRAGGRLGGIAASRPCGDGLERRAGGGVCLKRKLDPGRRPEGPVAIWSRLHCRGLR